MEDSSDKNVRNKRLSDDVVCEVDREDMLEFLNLEPFKKHYTEGQSTNQNWLYILACTSRIQSGFVRLIKFSKEI